jgi:glycine C-acetyltransferase
LPEVEEAARAAIGEYGVHSAGSPVLCGRTKLLRDVECQIATILGTEDCLVCQTGWSAGFGVIAGLVRHYDTVILDARSHNCLQEGTRHATKRVRKFPHNDLEALEKLLQEERSKKPKNGLFVILESLYSMDSDQPDLASALELTRRYQATMILDIAHDFGAMGARGLGLIEKLKGKELPDIVMGSFSKTFAANGGFIGCPTAVRHYLSDFGSPHLFSNAISPVQTGVVKCTLDLAFSARGEELRQALMRNILSLRSEMERAGMTAYGTPSPIVPVFVGDETIARLTSKHLFENGMLANLVEFPAVPRGAARFRFQVMATHSQHSILSAAQILSRSKGDAMREWVNLYETGAPERREANDSEVCATGFLPRSSVRFHFRGAGSE